MLAGTSAPRQPGVEECPGTEYLIIRLPTSNEAHLVECIINCTKDLPGGEVVVQRADFDLLGWIATIAFSNMVPSVSVQGWVLVLQLCS